MLEETIYLQVLVPVRREIEGSTTKKFFLDALNTRDSSGWGTYMSMLREIHSAISDEAERV